MAKAIFKVLFKVISSITNIILAPINALIGPLLPDFTAMLNTFTYVLNHYIAGGITWFFSILPPMCKTYIIIYLTFLVAYYTISISVHLIMKVYTIIKNIKIW